MGVAALRVVDRLHDLKRTAGSRRDSGSPSAAGRRLADDELVGRISRRRPSESWPFSIASSSHPAASNPFFWWGWATVVSGGLASAAAGHRRNRRSTARPGRRRRVPLPPEARRCEDVAHREHRGRRARLPEEVARCSSRGPGRIGATDAHGGFVPCRSEALWMARNRSVLSSSASTPSGSRAATNESTATRSWPSSRRCSAARRAASRSSIPTNGVGASRGWSTVTTGTPRASAASTRGSFRDAEYTMKPSTAAARTESAVASRNRESGMRSRPMFAPSMPCATPPRNAGAAGSVNW